ncbi:MAG: valine--tRNA ligase [Oligoflexia bacterium]|nr:valine--tRNA ligase [Oligoflexia bacterium]
MAELSKGYEPGKTEGQWYQSWESKKYFHASEDHKGQPFSLVIPPPNVTGSLHMGHALNNTLQDVLVRYKRMQGYNAVWIPGMDHAGIATQMVVERMLAKEGIKREQLGREKFVEKIWEWKAESGGMILGQQRRLGNSTDWERHRFTLDEGLSKAVRKVFVDLYQQKLIYQGHRLVNWCPRCVTAVSDLEVKHVETKGSLWHIRYPTEDGQGEVIVATTRPETMLGDTAVAVNPKDVRYKALVGKKVTLPLINRKIPIIADDVVDKDFGSGVVKMTPAHDFNDYETGLRHKLEQISIFDSHGVLNQNAGSFKGLKNPEARKKVLEALTDGGFLVKEEPHAMAVGKCDRCDAVIEPMLSDQWYVKIAPLAKPAIEAVESGKIKFVPENWTKTYLEWMYNIRDWCISRQLWWGHRIPAWHCKDCQHVTVSLVDATQCEKCKSSNIKQSDDVLDTWFSSALWPFSTMGWPEKTKALETWYPTNTLITGFDIIFFWVARMIMMGLHFMKEVPFHTVYIHGLVRDERGQKMSKSKGNVVDPLGLIEDFGADALRFTLVSLVGAGRDIKFSEDRLDGYRNFINKIWNATRFALGAVEGVTPVEPASAAELSLADRFIIYELERTIKSVTVALDELRFTDAAMELYQVTWGEFCDWYLELSKPVLYGQDSRAKERTAFVLHSVLMRLVKLLHPFTPFVTEEIYQKLPKHGESICLEKYPTLDDSFLKLGSKTSAQEISVIKAVVTGIRNIRGENRISPAEKIKARTVSTDKKMLEILSANLPFVTSLARLSELNLTSDLGETKKCAINPIAIGDSRLQVVVPLEGLVDLDEEIKRIQKEIEKAQKDLSLAERKLSQDTFVKNAPPEIVELEKTRQSQLTDRIKQLEQALTRLK